jgi:hypothetical protein
MLPQPQAARQKKYLQNKLKSCTEEDRLKLQTSIKNKNAQYQRESRERKRKGAVDTLSPHDSHSLAETGVHEHDGTRNKNALRQHRYRQRQKVKKAIAREHAEEVAATSLADEQTESYNWSNAHIKKNDVPPEYLAGHVIECPKKLQGDNALAAMMLEGVSVYFDKNWKSDEVHSVLNLADKEDNITGIRSIGGNRYELYIQVKGCIPAAFKTILLYSEKIRRKDPNLDLTDDVLGTLIGIIVAFLTERAREYEPLRSYAFQNFAYIVSFGKVPRQDIHIDLGEAKQYQMGMLCSLRGELTLEYECGEENFPPCGIGDKLMSFWGDLSPGLQAKLDKLPVSIQPLLDGYGPLLSPSIKKTGRKKPTIVPFGTMLCLPGRIMHCGPAVTEPNKVRQVIFFTGTPEEDKAKAYNTETQYCRSTLIHDILLGSWPFLDASEKEYMLGKWAKVGLRVDRKQAISENMNHQHLIAIASALEKVVKKKTDTLLKELISKIATDPIWNEAPHCREWWWNNPGTKDYELYKVPN